jgi:hypothetical protein
MFVTPAQTVLQTDGVHHWKENKNVAITNCQLEIAGKLLYTQKYLRDNILHLDKGSCTLTGLF